MKHSHHDDWYVHPLFALFFLLLSESCFLGDTQDFLLMTVACLLAHDLTNAYVILAIANENAVPSPTMRPEPSEEKCLLPAAFEPSVELDC